MGTILAISSQVARGHVGLSAVVPALQALGHEVIALPTIMLSNHPGHGAVAGQRMEPALLSRMLATLDAHGWLAGVDAVLSGYLPTQEHVAVVAEAVGLVRAHRAKAPFFCDPVLGDDPKGLYIAEDAARSLAERLVPLADVIFPNRFELQWLASQPVTDAASAAMAVTAEEAWTRTVVRMNGVPNGTGDLLAALFTGHMVNACAAPIALKRSVIGVQEAICASAGRDELNLIAILKGFRR